MKKQLNLPKSRIVNGEECKYISYSQYSSYSEIGEFHNQMVLQYIFKVPMQSRFEAYSKMGSACGEYIEDKSKKDSPLLNKKDKEILDGYIDTLPDDCEYEREVWIEMDGYWIYGFEDVFYQDKGEGVQVVDAKTGSIAKKAKFYSSEAYGQVPLYCYYEDVVKGNKIKYSGVAMFDRVGNAMKDIPDELHLSGEIKMIPIPYTRERAEKVLAKIDKVANEVSSLKTTYDAMSKLTLEF